MTVGGLDYYPSQFKIKKGVPVEWNIDGANARGCAQIITIPKLGMIKQLSRTEITTITFTAQEAGWLKFTCGMGMAGPGYFEVVP